MDGENSSNAPNSEEVAVLRKIALLVVTVMVATALYLGGCQEHPLAVVEMETG